MCIKNVGSLQASARGKHNGDNIVIYKGGTSKNYRGIGLSIKRLIMIQQLPL
ncbi:hypothetical protein GCM10027170_13580 [Aliiglaciecola aliphaticivorans]